MPRPMGPVCANGFCWLLALWLFLAGAAEVTDESARFLLLEPGVAAGFDAVDLASVVDVAAAVVEGGGLDFENEAGGWGCACAFECECDCERECEFECECECESLSLSLNFSLDPSFSLSRSRSLSFSFLGGATGVFFGASSAS